MGNKKGKIKSEVVRTVNLEDNDEIRISKSMKDGENVLCVDIRLFKLYAIDGHYDNFLKATGKGIHFSLDKLPDIISGLIDIFEDEYNIPFKLESGDEEDE